MVPKSIDRIIFDLQLSYCMFNNRSISLQERKKMHSSDLKIVDGHIQTSLLVRTELKLPLKKTSDSYFNIIDKIIYQRFGFLKVI